MRGKTSKFIFDEAGFDVTLHGINKCEQESPRWIKAYNNDWIYD